MIGGGPAGAYAACALAREGVSTVLLESDVFPRCAKHDALLIASFPKSLGFKNFLQTLSFLISRHGDDALQSPCFFSAMASSTVF